MHEHFIGSLAYEGIISKSSSVPIIHHSHVPSRNGPRRKEDFCCYLHEQYMLKFNVKSGCGWGQESRMGLDHVLGEELARL